MSGNRTLLANLCPFSWCGEVTGFAKDFAEAVGKSIEATTGGSVWQGATKQLEHVLSCVQRIEHRVESGALWCGRHRRLRNAMAGFGAGKLEFPLEIGQDHIEILHGHLGRGVPE